MDNIISNNVTKNIKYVNIADNELFDGHEQSILYNINDLKEVNTSYLFKSLNDLDIDGSLIANYRDNNELKQMFLPKTHKIILGTTGSGKTQSYILPYIHTISSFKNKHSMLITDVKGEIYKNCAHHLKEQGYEIKVLNFINPNSSNFWNPFYEICDLIDKSNQLNNNIKEFNSIPKDIINDGHGFKDLNSFQKWYYIDNKGFKVKEDAKTYLNITLEKIDMKIDKIIYNIAYSIIKDNDPKDRFWDSNARDIFRAVVWKFVEMYRNKLITRKQFNFKEIISLIINYNFSDIDDFIKNKPTNNLIMNLIGKIRGTATETKGTILTSLSSSLSDFKSYSTYYLTLEDEISLKTFDDKPIALFILLDELDKGIFSFIGLIVQTLYRTLNEIAKEKEDDKLTRPFEFILEEFGNVPKLENFTQMLSLSRSKDI